MAATEDLQAMHHRRAQRLLDAYRQAEGTPPAAELDRATPHERAMAAAAWAKTRGLG